MRRNFSCLAVGLFFLAIPFSASFGAGIGDSLGFNPYWNWKTLESEHFRMTFPADLEPQARKATEYLEEAHILLSGRLHWEPNSKTQVVAVDNTDLANGLTSAALRLGMILMLTPPDTTFSTQYYDNWLRLLCIHEYTHFLNMDATRDWVKILRYVFGDAIRVNAMWPSWMLEGLAVYMETRLTSAGRGRSPFYEMILRAAVEENLLTDSSFISLDRVNGTNPYFPGGETAYLFGYQLMNQVAKDPNPGSDGRSADGGSPLKGGDDTLGLLSWRSAGRVPFFINGNLENVAGKDWYRYWKEWLAETRARMMKQLARIKSQPVTAFKKLSDPSMSILGIAVSPDLNWLAYTQDSSDEKMSLYLKNLKSGETTEITEKIWGVGLSFTPDSRHLVFSSVQRQGLYSLFSDLSVYDLKNKSIRALSDGARFKDPSVSPNGKQVVFTVNSKASNSIAVADLISKGSKWKLGPARIVFQAKPYGSAANAKFSPDGQHVVFSWHADDTKGTALVRVNVETLASETILSDEKTNRFPAFGPSGDLYFVSDRTGVDNLYRVRRGVKSGPAEQITNVTTGVWFPAVASSGGADEVYASVFSGKGWSLAQVSVSDKPFNSAASVVDAAPAPAYVKSTSEEQKEAKAASVGEVQDYSIFPSIYPRQWAPVLYGDKNRSLIGGQVLGFDAIDHHQYLIYGAYDTLVKTGDGLIQYNNRSFGPTLSLSGDLQTTGYTLTNNKLTDYSRKARARAGLSYPIKWTFSSLTPAFGAQAEREFFYTSSNFSRPAFSTRFNPSIDFTLTYSDVERSRLAIQSESGRRIQGGVRRYFDKSGDVHKGLLSWAEYIELFNHTVAVPSVGAAWSSRTTPVSDALVNAKGRSSSILTSNDTPLERSLDLFRIRGYPGQGFLARSLGVGALDLQMPISQIFRGWGTNPIFFRQIYLVGFGEATYLPKTGSRDSITVPSAGAGLRLRTDVLLNLPLTFSTEYHKGFKKEFGGKSELFFAVLADSLF